MDDVDDILQGSLVHVVEARFKDQAADRSVGERAEDARKLTDEARLQLANLAGPAIAVIALRLAGEPNDWDGRPIGRDREDTAWEVLSRIGVPRLRATAVAASIAASTLAPAPDSPGWVDPDAEDGEGEEKELDPTSVDAQIESFLAGARAQRDLGSAQ